MTNKKNKDWRIVCTAIVCIAALEGVALYLGFNGTMLKIALVAIAGLAGWALPSPIK